MPDGRRELRHRGQSYWEQRADAIDEEVGTYIREVFASDDVLLQLRTVQANVTYLEGHPAHRARAVSLSCGDQAQGRTRASRSSAWLVQRLVGLLAGQPLVLARDRRLVTDGALACVAWLHPERCADEAPNFRSADQVLFGCSAP